MNTSRNVAQFQKPTIVQTLNRLVVAMAIAGFSVTAQAGKITSVVSASGPYADGFGGWNLDNVEVVLNGALSAFVPATGAYSVDPDGSDFSYESRVFDDSVIEMGKVLAKDWPVGEPAGIKIVNDDFDTKDPKPTNCIMSTSYLDGHFLNDAAPEQVICSGPFQSHKRFKVAMLPSTVDGGNESIDLVFNVEAEAGSRDYQIFQKINNWTGVRLEGFTVQVGTGIGNSFIPASDPILGVGLDKLSLSVPSDIWSKTQLADFSTGLFGPIDTKHDRPAGFFDPVKRAGFEIVEYGNVGDTSGQTAILTSGITLGSTYADVPPGTDLASSGTANQFGKWLPNTMLPFGIFFDDDGNPDTDAELKAWYAYNPTTGGFTWMRGVADGYLKVEDTTIDTWSSNPLYSMAVIDDLVNVGLNYVVTIDDVTTFSTFTIRITPVAEAMPTLAPSYVGETPIPALVYASNDANVTLTPSPEFVPGSLLTTRVGDGDRNTPALDTVDVTVNATGTTVIADEPLTLTELGLNRGVFVANLPEKFSNVAAGTTVSVTYADTVTDLTAPGDITVTSLAVGSLPAGTLQFNPVTYSVAENDGSVTVAVSRTDGSLGVVTVDYQTVSGTAIAGQDYIADTDSTLTFGDGVVSQTITVALVNDAVAEGDESFTILLSNAQGGGVTLGADSTATVTLTDTDVAITDTPVYTGTTNDGLFSFSWMTLGLIGIGLLARTRRKTS